MDSTQRNAVGERLAQIRARAGLSQKEFGTLLSISWRSYQNYELGSREPPADVIAAICQEYGVRYHWLINGEGGMKANNDLESLRRIITEVENLKKEKELEFTGAASADVIVRLYQRECEGDPVSNSEVKNYVELAGGKQR